MVTIKCDLVRKKAEGINVNWKKILRRRVPLIRRLRTYTLGTFLQDALAGFTVALVKVPQAISFAMLAGLPPQYGLYSGFMGGFVYYFFGSCLGVTIGPTALMAHMIQPHVETMGAAGAVLLCFMSGCIILVLALLRLGFVVEFFSYPVVVGFTAAATLYITILQTRGLLGIDGKSDKFLEALIHMCKHITETRKWDAILGILSIIFLVFSTEMKKFGTLPYRPDWSRRRNILGRCIFVFSNASNATTILVGTLLGYIFDNTGISPFVLTGNIEGGLPPFELPPFSADFNGMHFTYWDMIKNYGYLVIFCPLIAVVEHLAVGKVVSKGRPMDGTQELLCLGLTNILGSFVHSIPLTGSFIRTAVNKNSGIRTTTCGLVAGIVVLLTLGFSIKVFQYIPKATVAAVIIVSMYYFCDFLAFVTIWKTKKMELIPLSVTFFCSLLFSLEYGMLIGLATNLAFLLYKSIRPQLMIEKPLEDVFIIKLDKEVYFSAAEYTVQNILESCNGEKTTFVLNGQYLEYIDATWVKTFSILKEELLKRNQNFVLLDFKESIVNICAGADKELKQYFKNGSLEQIVIHRI